MSRLPVDVDGKLHAVFELLTAESLRQPVGGPFPGLSRINADGLPFQWVLRASEQAVDFGFLCEVGRPGDAPRSRLALSRQRLDSACEICACTNDWLDGVASILIPTSAEPWPSHWRSALWIGVVPMPRGVLLKPYFNLNLGSARDRWLRAGRVLRALGRERGLASLCDLSARVSQDSWPVGLTVDVLPGGVPGRVKVYFRSDAVGLEWLGHWYEAAGHGDSVGLARRFLDAFPLNRHRIYPEAAFTVGLEFHPRSPGLGLKTDLAVTKWMASDAEILRASKALTEEKGACGGRLEEALGAVGAIPASAAMARSFRFVGLGHEPDHSSHLNVYLEPHPRPRRRSGRGQARSLREAIHAGSRFLLDARHGDCWVDFELPVGASNVWVTAYTLARLAAVNGDLLPGDGPTLIARSLDWLASVRSTTGGWSFNPAVPDDADSTAWAILALRRHRRRVPDCARDFVSLCRDAQGSFTTYPRKGPTRDLWTATAPDVTAAAMFALEERWSPTVESLVSRWWTSDGTLPAYWWTSRFYTLALLLEAFPELASSPAVNPAMARVDEAIPANAFDSALLLLSLVLLKHPRAAAMASELHHMQRSEGSWPSSALLRLPSPETKTPWAGIASGPLFADQNAIFTTSTAVAALTMLLASGGT